MLATVLGVSLGCETLLVLTAGEGQVPLCVSHVVCRHTPA
jgi:hypothetical protein